MNHCIVLNDADLTKENYNNCSLPFTDFENRHLDGVSLTFADLSNAIFSGATVVDADFTGSNLMNTRFIFATISGADFSNSDLSNANLSNSLGVGTNFVGADVLNLNLFRARILDSDLSGTKLVGANMAGITLTGSDLIGTDLTGVNISSSDLSGTNMSSADLFGVDLRSTDLTDANLSNTNLQNADFAGSILVNTDFTGCTGTPSGIPAVGELPTCNAFPTNDLVLDEDFEIFSGWTTIGAGSVDSVTASGNTVSGDKVALKFGRNDPNGAYKQLSTAVDDYEMIVYAKKTISNGGSAMRYSITQDSDGNGYGFYLTPSQLTIEKRGVSFITSEVASAPVSGWDGGEWNTFRFIKVANELQLEFYKNQIVQPNDMDRVDPSISLAVTNNDYSGGFNFASIHGGTEYETDDYQVRAIANTP